LLDKALKRDCHPLSNGGTVRSRQNRQLLEYAMKQQGFTGLATEWWHFDASGWEIYSVTDVPFEKIPKI
jgi:zinc D-Ala-D-Ala dipeptidase